MISFLINTFLFIGKSIPLQRNSYPIIPKPALRDRQQRSVLITTHSISETC